MYPYLLNVCNNSAVTRTYSDLHRMVVFGELDPGIRVTEAELATRLGVSRTPVREALHRLEGDGLVIAQGRGVRVRVMGIEEISELLDARSGLEGWALHQAAQRVRAGEVPPARITELERLADDAYAHTRAGDVVHGANANRAFHEHAAALANNTQISATLSQWWDRITVSTRHTIRTPDRVEDVDHEHRVILEALRAGDPHAAREAAQTHILTTRDALLRLHEGTRP